MRPPCFRPGPSGAGTRSARARLLAPALVLALFAVPARAGWWDDAASARETTLDVVREEPSRWRDVPILLRVTYQGDAEPVQAYFTQFAPARWRPVKVRGVGNAPGPEFGHLFVRRAGRDDLRLPGLRIGQRVQVRAVVRDDVRGEPWIEVLSFTLPGDTLTPEEQARVVAADNFLAHSNAEAAMPLYRELLGSRPLADADHAALLRKLAMAQHESGDARGAVGSLRAALAIAPDHADTRARLARLEAALDGRGDAPIVPPPTAASTGPSVPRVPARPPLLLPGGVRPLAPPRGLGSTGDAAPATGGPAKEGTPTKSAPLPPAKPAAEPPTPGESPAPDPPVEEDVPPLPPPPKLSDPK